MEEDGLKTRRLRTGRWAVASSLQGSRRPPSSPLPPTPAPSNESGKGKPNLVSFALAKIHVCMERKLIQIRLGKNQNFLGLITERSREVPEIAESMGLVPSISQLSLVSDLSLGSLCLSEAPWHTQVPAYSLLSEPPAARTPPVIPTKVAKLNLLAHS